MPTDSLIEVCHCPHCRPDKLSFVSMIGSQCISSNNNRYGPGCLDVKVYAVTLQLQNDADNRLSSGHSVLQIVIILDYGGLLKRGRQPFLKIDAMEDFDMLKKYDKKKMYDMYINAFTRNIIAFYNNMTTDPLPFLKRLIFYGVKVVNNSPEHDFIDRNDAVLRFQFTDYIRTAMSTITLKDFMTLFPIKKNYDGHRWGCKDYFYTYDYN